jgi:hypothetical protein
MKHEPSVRDGETPHVYRAQCSCGWYARRWTRDRSIAEEASRQHAADAGACRKVQFTEKDARQAIVDARIMRELRGSTRRREDRVYLCPECASWHLTSQPESRKVSS